MSKTCKKCGKKGHNSRTCGRIKLVIKSGCRVCSNCGIEGHNIRTCPIIHGKKNEKEIIRGVRVCGYCGEKGHNRRTCLKLGYKGVTEKIIDSIVKIRTNFKDENDFLKFVYPDTEIEDMKPEKYPHVIVTLHYTRGTSGIIGVKGYYLLTKGLKFIELYELDKQEYSVRRGVYKKKSNTTRKYTKTLTLDIKARIEHYSKKYQLVYGG